MPFQPGNQEGKKAAHLPRRMVTQQLISALNESAKKGEPARLRKVVDALIAEAEGGDVQAIKEIFDRIEGKAPQPLQGDPERPLTMQIISGVPRASDGN